MPVTKEMTMKCTEENHCKFYVLQLLDCSKDKCDKCRSDWYTCDDHENRFKVRSDYGRMQDEDNGVEYQNRKTENSCVKSFPTEEDADKFFWKKYNEKLKKGYKITFQRIGK